MKTILLFIVFFSFSYASNIINIDDTFKKNEDFKVGYIFDKNNSLSFKDIKNKTFNEIGNFYSFGVSSPIWIKLELYNSTDVEKSIYLHDAFAYFSSKITLYHTSNSQLKDKKIFNVLEDANSNELTGSTLAYPIKLQAKGTSRIYLKIEPMVMLLNNFGLYIDKEHHTVLINKNIFSYFIIFLIFSLALYNILLYFNNKKSEHIYYSLYLLNAALGFAYLYGIIFDLEFYGENAYWFNLNAILVPLFLSLFIESVFRFKINNIFVHKLFNTLIYFTLLLVFFAVFIDLNIAIDIMPVSYIYSFLIILYMSYILRKQKHPLAFVFLSAYLIYIVGMTLSSFSFLSYMSINLFTFYASGIGISLEVLIFSYIVHYQIQELEAKIIRHEKKLLLKSQKEQMGDMIGAITHQWKQPLTSLSALIMLLEYKLESHDFNQKFFLAQIHKMNQTLIFLDDTVNDFRNFFSKENIKEECDLEKLILKAISLNLDDINATHVSIEYDLKFTKTLYIYSNELLHIILNIIQNSKEAFRDMEVSEEYKKIIHIVGRTENKMTFIDITDNAGGISKNDLPYIFQESFTTKAKENGTGLGLYLSKTMIEEHLNGKISVENTENGTKFRILL